MFARASAEVLGTRLHYIDGGCGAPVVLSQNRETASKKLNMPVLAIGGADRPGPVMQKMLEPVAEDLRTSLIEASGHFVPEEAPAELVRLLLDFLR